MKISKQTRWILTIGILAILLVSLGVNYNRQETEQDELSANIAQAHQDFIRYTTQNSDRNKDLEARLSKVNPRLAALQDKFESPTESIEISTALFEAAAGAANVTITGLSSSTPAGEKVNDIAFHAFSLGISAEGEVEALLNFMANISSRFPNSSINSVNISISEEKTSLNLNVKIYTYEAK